MFLHFMNISIEIHFLTFTWSRWKISVFIIKMNVNLLLYIVCKIRQNLQLTTSAAHASERWHCREIKHYLTLWFYFYNKINNKQTFL